MHESCQQRQLNANSLCEEDCDDRSSNRSLFTKFFRNNDGIREPETIPQFMWTDLVSYMISTPNEYSLNSAASHQKHWYPVWTVLVVQ